MIGIEYELVHRHFRRGIQLRSISSRENKIAFTSISVDGVNTFYSATCQTSLGKFLVTFV